MTETVEFVSKSRGTFSSYGTGEMASEGAHNEVKPETSNEYVLVSLHGRSMRLKVVKISSFLTFDLSFEDRMLPLHPSLCSRHFNSFLR